MSQKISKQRTTKRQKLSEDKRAAVLGKNDTKRSFSKWILPTCLALILVVVISIYAVGSFRSSPDGKPNQEANINATYISLPTDQFEDGKARHYAHQTDDGITVRYFVLKSSDGFIRAAFDACDVCWRANKGYSQSGDFMVCNNCGRQFASIKVNEVKGGCNPAPLTRRVENGNVIIEKADIAIGKKTTSILHLDRVKS